MNVYIFSNFFVSLYLAEFNPDSWIEDALLKEDSFASAGFQGALIIWVHLNFSAYGLFDQRERE